MVEALRNYLLGLGYADVFVDYMPADPDPAIGLFGWSDDHGFARDGSAVRFVQIQVRGADAQQTKRDCQAIGATLDSGVDEIPIPLNFPGAVIGTLRRGPLLLNRTPQTVTYYCEVALWGLRD